MKKRKNDKTRTENDKKRHIYWKKTTKNNNKKQQHKECQYLDHFSISIFLHILLNILCTDG